MDFNNIKYDKNGLVPVVTQDEETGEVLMLAYANKEALEKTLESKVACYWSRSRNEIWIKGKTSGNYQYIREIKVDCDKDAVLYLVNQVGFACHTGKKSCFDNYKINIKTVSASEYEDSRKNSKNEEISKRNVLNKVYETIEDRKSNKKEGSYTNYLFEKGMDKILKKIGEESAEVIIAAKNKDNVELTNEISDLLYHLSVLMVEAGITYDEIFNELSNRAKKSST